MPNTLQWPMICHQAGAQKTVREHNWNCWHELVKRTFCIEEPHVQDINWVKLARRHWSWLRNGLGIGQQVIRKCVVHLFHLGFTPHFFSIPFIFICSSSSSISIISIYFTLFQLFKCSCINPQALPFFLSNSTLHPARSRHWGGKGSEEKNREGTVKELASGCVVISCKLKLSHGRFNAGKDGNYETKGKTRLAEL